MTKPPAFQFYARDFYVSTVTMSSAQVGAYMRALSWSWDNGPLPLDMPTLARLLLVTTVEARKLWSVVGLKFIKTDAGYINKRLEQEREKQQAYREVQANKGRAAAQHRLNRGLVPALTERQPDTQPKSNSALASASADQNQDQNPRSAPVSILDVRGHLRKACHELIESGVPALQPGTPFFDTEMAEQLKLIAARHLHVDDYDGTEIRKIIDAVVGERQRRMQREAVNA